MRHNRDSTRYRHDTLEKRCTAVYRFHFHHDPAFRNVMSTLSIENENDDDYDDDERRTETETTRETTMSDEWKPKIIISIVQLLGSSKFKSFFTKLNWVSSTKECACWISAFYVLESDLREIFVFFMKEKEWKFEFSKFTKFVLRIFSLLELNWWRVVFSGSESWTSRLFSKMKILMVKFEFQELLYVDWMRYNLLWITKMRLFSFVCCFSLLCFWFFGIFCAI